MFRYPNASDGLKLMFYGEILVIIGTLLVWLPLVGVLLLLIGGIVSLVGLNRAGKDDEGYRTAFMLNIINIIVGLFSGGNGTLSAIMSIISSLISLAVIYFVCTTTANLLHSVGAVETEQRGRTVWNINLVCTVVSVVLMLLAFIPIVNILAAVGMIIVVIAELVGYVLYLMFLNASYQALQ